MKKAIIALGIFSLVTATAGIALAAESITLVGGSTSIVTVINPIKAAFEKATGIALHATALGSKVALQKLDAGDAEVATAGHSFEELTGVIKKDNIVLKNPLESLKWVQLAPPASYKVIVNSANPVSALSKEQLAGIFTGKIANWKEVGGKDAGILCVISNLSPGTNEAFSKTFLDGKKISVDTLDASSAADLRQNVASNPDAIGFVAAGFIDGTVKGVETLEMKSKPIILLTIGAPSEKVQKLIDFVKSEGSKYIK
jgi:phosphate transport system substrate-binding protein